MLMRSMSICPSWSHSARAGLVTFFCPFEGAKPVFTKSMYAILVLAQHSGLVNFAELVKALEDSKSHPQTTNL